MLVVPSPKFEANVVTDPVVVLAKATLNGAAPLLALALKFTTGAGALTLMAVAAVLLRSATGYGGSENCTAGVCRRASGFARCWWCRRRSSKPRGDRSGGRVGEGNTQGCDAVAGLASKQHWRGRLTLIAWLLSYSRARVRWQRGRLCSCPACCRRAWGFARCWWCRRRISKPTW